MTSPVDEWISLPGFSVDDDVLNNGTPDGFIKFIDEHECAVSFRPADVFIISGNKEFTLIYVNKLKPEMLWIPMSEKKVKEVLFSNVETV